LLKIVNHTNFENKNVYERVTKMYTIEFLNLQKSLKSLILLYLILVLDKWYNSYWIRVGSFYNICTGPFGFINGPSIFMNI